jgi:murein DD-endopeptidase MepM/ murein hydrolase activator NlpD
MNQKKVVVALVALTLTASLAFLAVRPWRSAAAPEVAAPAAPPPQAAAPESAAPPTAPALKTETLEIRKRDTIVAALLRHGVSSANAHAIATALSAAGANLRQVRAGDEMQLSRDAEGRLLKLAYAPTAWVRFEVTEGDTGWKADRSAVDPEVRVEVRQADLQRSLWDAVESGALTPSVLLDLVQIFESEFDFTADTRAGDKLRLLVETRYAQGVPVDHGRILAAQYVSDGKLMTGVGFGGGDRFAYYDPEGRSLRKMFLRSPLQFTRISSGFTYRRPHPILGGLRPHLAIDYVAPVGTPVWAVADGVVEFAGRKGGNGLVVVLQHRGGFET